MLSITETKKRKWPKLVTSVKTIFSFYLYKQVTGFYLLTVKQKQCLNLLQLYSLKSFAHLRPLSPTFWLPRRDLSFLQNTSEQILNWLHRWTTGHEVNPPWCLKYNVPNMQLQGAAIWCHVFVAFGPDINSSLSKVIYVSAVLAVQWLFTSVYVAAWKVTWLSEELT